MGMDTAHSTFTIGRLAKEAGVGIDTVRFYEREGLLAEAPRTASGYRVYRAGDAKRLKFIRRAKALGFTLQDIAELLNLAEDGQSRSKVKALAERRVADLDRRLREMKKIRAVLNHHVRHCSGRGTVKGCPIIAALTGEAVPA